MNKIEKLINELCPGGVEFKELGEIAKVSGAGVDKKINPNEKPVKLLNYMDVYRNKYLNKDIPSMEVTASNNKILQCNILKGDLFITPSSEVLNDIGNSAVAIEDFPNTVYSYHIMRIRLNEFNIITSMFINYVFESGYIQNQINKNAKGITRFGLTKTQWEKIKIPIPPIPIQEEIVKILDSFKELEAELEARKKQYEYYEDKLLFDNEYECVPLIELCKINQGLQIPISQRKKEPGENRYFYITVQFLKRNIDNFYIENPPASVICEDDDILVTRTGSTGIVVTGIKGCFHNNFFKVNCKENIRKKFMYHILRSKRMYNRMLTAASGGTVPDLPHSAFYKLVIPLPSLLEQERIVEILDKFDKLVNDVSVGLPAELESRRKQYEYYREKLLTFKEVKAND